MQIVCNHGNHSEVKIINLFLQRAYLQEKVATWAQEVDQLNVITESEPHAAYAAFTHCLASKWTFLAHIGDLFQCRDDAIRQCFLPTHWSECIQ